jgi:hypothetical protein
MRRNVEEVDGKVLDGGGEVHLLLSLLVQEEHHMQWNHFKEPSL